MIIETAVGTALVGGLFAQVNKSMEIDEKAMKKNVKAFTKMAESENKLVHCQQKTIDKLMICAKRKNGILNGHIKMFKEQFEVIRKVEFKSGQGIEELEKFDEIIEKLNHSISVAGTENRLEMTTPQTLISFALFGIGGLMIKDSEMNLKMATKTVAQANAMAAQVDSICIALEGLARHSEIVTELLQKLGVMYMQSIRNITDILKKNGMDSNNYSQMDIESINVSLLITKVIYRIINTPMVNADGKIEQESLKVIDEGNDLLKRIGNN